jgi:hypothetical protein
VAGIEAVENAGFRTIDGSIASHSSAIIGSINSSASLLLQAIYELTAKTCGSERCGGGGLSDLFWMGGPKGMPEYARGGDFITNGPQIIQVGEAGPERVTISPMSGTRPSSLGISLETSHANKQLSDLMTKIANSPVTIPVKLELELDSYQPQADDRGNS